MADVSVQKIQAGDDLAQGRDLAGENRRKLAELFPGILTETAGPDGVTPAIDVDALRDLVGATVDSETREKFGLSWHGKSAARRLALTPSAGTLRPAPAESVDWDTTGNVLIEGDNLEVLKLLQKAYAGKVKLIYIDPPYNTGNDFVYKDDFRDPIGHYQRTIGDVDEEGVKITSNAESGGRFHTTWLNMIYPRLLLARELLREDGSIFVSIDDSEAENLTTVLNEVFGEENHLATVVWQKVFSPKPAAKTFSTSHDYILVFGRNAASWDRRLLPRGEEQDARYENPDNDPRGPWSSGDLLRIEHRENSVYTLVGPTGKEWRPRAGSSWRHPEDEMRKLIENNEVWFGKDGNSMPRRKKFLANVQAGMVPETLWLHKLVGHTQEAKREVLELFEADVFPTPKPTRLLAHMLQMSTADNDLILDFFAGSGTTGHAVMAQNAADGGNRKSILVQLPEPTGRDDYKTIADLTAERLRRAGAKIKAEHGEQLAAADPNAKPLDTGFRVFKLDSANVKAWEAPTTDKAAATQIGGLLEAAVDAVKFDRTDADLLWGVMLNLGLPLESKVETRKAEGLTLHVAGGGTLMCCFDKSIDLATGERLADALAAIAREKQVEGELTVVLRDSAFAGKDAAKVNLVENLKQRLPESVTKSRVLSI